MIRLRTLGGFSIEQDGHPVAGAAEQRKALALLVAIANAGDRGISRDRLLALLWPESPTERARNALNQILHAIRRALGNDQAVLGVSELRLNPRVIAVDAHDFDQALESGACERAVLLYAGPFLDGFHVRDAPEFEQWAETERSRLADRFARALERLARADADRGDYASAVSRFRRLAVTDPLNSRYVGCLMEALVKAGDPGGALQAAQAHTTLLRAELNVPPDASIAVMAARLQREGAERAALTQPLPRPPTIGEVLGGPVGASESVQATETVEPPSPPATLPLLARARWRQRTTWVATALGGTLGLGLVIVLAATLLAPGGPSAGQKSADGNAPLWLAVLPFENAGDSADAYLADGVTDAIRGKLSALPALRLIASTSSDQYRGTQKSAEQIGRELNVHYLLTGRVRWELGADGARRVRVSPELIEVRDSAAPETKWRQSYDTTLADVFDVQAAVAARVADKLGVVLGPPVQARLATRPTRNLAAYDAYLRSMALAGSDVPTSRRSLSYAEQAVAWDSTFAAAWARVAALHAVIYFRSVPTSADGEAARQAAERAVSLAPTEPDGYEALGDYALRVPHDLPAALTAFATAVRLAPSSAASIYRLALAERATGQWEQAVAHLRQAAALDPRSRKEADHLSRTLLFLRRYLEARAEAARGLALAPVDLDLTETVVLSHLGEGDLTAARAALHTVPPTVERGALVVFVATFLNADVWMLDDADRALLLTLPPAAFDDDRGTWGLVRAQVYWLAGDTVRCRAYADSARRAFEDQLRTVPSDWQRHLLLGLARARLGEQAAAAREGERGVAIVRASNDQLFIPYAEHTLARLYVAAGYRQKALDQLETLLKVPYLISPAWLKIDPTWAPLKGDPRFERMIGGQ